MRFSDFNTTKKGALGEAIVRNFMDSRGWIVYPVGCDCPHAVDMLCWQHDGESDRWAAVDAKAYSRLRKYPRIGVDPEDWRRYTQLRSIFPDVLLGFVDDWEECLYFGSVSHLEGCEETIGQKLTFPLAKMHFARWLSNDEVRNLRALSAVDYTLYEDRFFKR